MQDYTAVDSDHSMHSHKTWKIAYCSQAMLFSASVMEHRELVSWNTGSQCHGIRGGPNNHGWVPLRQTIKKKANASLMLLWNIDVSDIWSIVLTFATIHSRAQAGSTKEWLWGNGVNKLAGILFREWKSRGFNVLMLWWSFSPQSPWMGWF